MALKWFRPEIAAGPGRGPKPGPDQLIQIINPFNQNLGSALTAQRRVRRFGIKRQAGAAGDGGHMHGPGIIADRKAGFARQDGNFIKAGLVDQAFRLRADRQDFRRFPLFGLGAQYDRLDPRPV